MFTITLSTCLHHPFQQKMAYNREWDKGKDHWNDTWAAETRGIPRGRDDEYQGEGKRRKFNTGVSTIVCPFQTFRRGIRALILLMDTTIPPTMPGTITKTNIKIPPKTTAIEVQEVVSTRNASYPLNQAHMSSSLD